MSAKYDAAIIGGGPAGLAAAIALSRIGARCLVIDFKRPPIDKACGEGLMPDSLGALAALGVHLPAGFGVAFKGIRFNCKGHATAAAFPQGVGLGVQRTALHQLLYEHASNENIAFSWRSKVEILDGQRLIVRSDTTCDTIDCHWLIGADGQKSYVRQFFGFEEVGAIPPRVGFRRHFYCSAWSEMVEVYWSNIGQLFIGPVSADEICVAFLARSRSVKFDDALRAFPGVWERLAKATAGKLMGAPTTNRVLKRVALNKVALIGDASGSVDAATGEGMALSFRQAAALSDAIAHGDLSAYEARHKAIMRLPLRMARIMLLLDRFPGAQEPVIKALARNPQTFSRLLSAHVGEQSLVRALATEAPSLVWNLAFA